MVIGEPVTRVVLPKRKTAPQPEPETVLVNQMQLAPSMVETGTQATNAAWVLSLKSTKDGETSCLVWHSDVSAPEVDGIVCARPSH